MGHYIIEGQVLFSPEEQLIKHIASDESVGLSVIATQILAMLLNRHGHVVERETIFTEIFDRYSAASTNNNLNQYMLTLRKQLHFFGIENEIIQTVPRIGFMVPVSVDVTYEEPIIQPQIPPDFATALPALQARRGILLARLWIAAMVILTVFIGFRFWQEDKADISWNDYPRVKVIPLNDDKMCQIFLVPSGLGYKEGDDINAEAMRKNSENLTCDAGINTRYYLFYSAIQEGKFRNFVLKCTGDAVHRPACFSRYLSVEQPQ